MKVLQIREELYRQGWPRRYLRWDERAAKIDHKNNTTGFIPWKRRHQIFSRPFLPVDLIISKGMEISFSNVLSGDRMFYGLAEMFLTSSYEPTHVRGRRMFVGPTILSEDFPFEKWLTIEDIGGYDYIIRGKNYWKMSYITLTYITELTIRESSE